MWQRDVAEKKLLPLVAPEEWPSLRSLLATANALRKARELASHLDPKSSDPFPIVWTTECVFFFLPFHKTARAGTYVSYDRFLFDLKAPCFSNFERNLAERVINYKCAQYTHYSPSGAPGVPIFQQPCVIQDFEHERGSKNARMPSPLFHAIDRPAGESTDASWES